MPYPRRARAGAIAIAIVLSVVYGSQWSDFYVFLDAAVRLREHINIYSAPVSYCLQYYYSPLFALLLMPFSFLPFGIPSAAWVLFSCYLLFRIGVLACHYLSPARLPPRGRQLWLGLVLFFSCNIILYNIWCGQMTIFLVWATLCSLRLFDDKKDLAGASLLALAINIKIMPGLLLPYLLYKRHYRAFIYTIGLVVLYLLLPAFFIGFGHNNELLASWWQVIDPTNPEHRMEADPGLHSLVSTIPVYLADTQNELGLKINIINIGLRNAELVCTAIRVLLVLLSLPFLIPKHNAQVPDRARTFWQISYFLLITPLISPHQNKYSYFYLFPAFIYLIYFLLLRRMVHHKKDTGLLVYLLALSVIFTPFIGRDLIGNYWFDWLQLHRFMVLSSLLLAPALWRCKPEKMVMASG